MSSNSSTANELLDYVDITYNAYVEACKKGESTEKLMASMIEARDTVTRNVRKSTFYNQPKRCLSLHTPLRMYPSEKEEPEWEFVDEKDLAEEVWVRVNRADYVDADSEMEYYGGWD